MLLNNHPNPNGIQPYTNQSVGFGQASQSLIHSSKKDETYEKIKKNGKKTTSEVVKWNKWILYMNDKMTRKTTSMKGKKTENDLS